MIHLYPLPSSYRGSEMHRRCISSAEEFLPHQRVHINPVKLWSLSQKRPFQTRSSLNHPRNMWAGSAAIVNRKVSRFLEPHFCSALYCGQYVCPSHSLARTHSLVFSLLHSFTHRTCWCHNTTSRIQLCADQEYNCVLIKPSIRCIFYLL